MSYKDIMRRFRELKPVDFKVLAALETGMEKYEVVPLEVVSKISGLPSGEASHRLNKLEKFRLLLRFTEPYLGYRLNYFGLDFLALKTFTDKNVIEALGEPLGVGKEADVYEALTSTGETVAVKFHKLGRVSFRQTKRVRSYTTESIQWYNRSKIAAKREYEALKKLYPAGVAVTKPIAHSRHALVTEKFEGFQLSEVSEISNPREILDEIFKNVRLAYLAGIIHADLSQFNILVSSEGKIQIIDWPQHVTVSHPNAEQLLRRDLENILNFFRRKFKVSLSLEEALKKVKG
jgi:RIO kinase 2